MNNNTICPQDEVIRAMRSKTCSFFIIELTQGRTVLWWIPAVCMYLLLLKLKSPTRQAMDVCSTAASEHGENSSCLCQHNTSSLNKSFLYEHVSDNQLLTVWYIAIMYSLAVAVFQTSNARTAPAGGGAGPPVEKLAPWGYPIPSASRVRRSPCAP